MQVNELRVGNWVCYPFGGNQQIRSGLDIDSIYGSAANPIPLTPKILEKCGFENVQHGVGLRVYEGYVLINSLFNSHILTLEIAGNRMPLKNIKHLHQLQNLYFVLTGEELEINL